MPTPEKAATIEEFKQHVEKSQIVVATQYVGINAEQATTLRKKLREGNVQFKVYKNTLVKRALDELGYSEAASFMEGPTAWAFCEDVVAPAKLLKEYAKEAPCVAMMGGILEGSLVDQAQLDALASMPPREALLAQVVGTMAAPLRNFVSVLSAPTRNLVNVLDQIKKQKEEAAA